MQSRHWLFLSGIALVGVALLPLATRENAPSADTGRADLATGSSSLDAVTLAQNDTPSESPIHHPGYKVYKQRGCSVCHGRNLEGSRMGPSLAEVSEHFDRPALRGYLSNPDSVIAKNDRLARLDREYDMFQMPGFQLKDAEFESLADLLLSRDE